MAVRVLNLFTIMDRGGAETMCMNLYRHIDRDQVQFDFLVYYPERGQYEDEIEKLGGKVYRIPKLHPRSLIAHIRGARAFFREHPEYQIVHDHMGSNGVFILWAAKMAGIKTRIYHSHAAREPIIADTLKLTCRRLVYRTLDAMALRLSNYFFACGPWAAEAYKKGKKVHVLSNAIDIEKFRFNEAIRERKRKELGCQNKMIIGNVARIDALKNQTFAVEIIRALVKKRQDIELWLVGDGIQKNEVRELAKEKGVLEYIRFLGVRSDVSELLQAMDVFLFPSINEGLPVSCIEAQAAGLPCVFSDGFDPSTVVVSDNCRVLSLSEPPQVWAEAIIKMSGRGRRDTADTVREEGYDIKRTSEYMLKFYLLKSKGGQTRKL